MSANDGTACALGAVRPLTQGDAALVARGFELPGEKSRYLRWGTDRVRIETAIGWMDALDGERGFAVGACGAADGQPIGLARYAATGPGVAELAVTVVDSAQGQGYGRLLLHELLPYAVLNGFETLQASIRLGNTPAIRLMRGIGGTRRAWGYGGVLEYQARLGREQVHHLLDDHLHVLAEHRRAR